MAVHKRKETSGHPAPGPAEDMPRAESAGTVYGPRPLRGDVDFDALRKKVMASISKTREYLAR